MKNNFTSLIMEMSKYAFYGIFWQCLLFTVVTASETGAQNALKAKSVNKVAIDVDFEKSTLSEVFSTISSTTDFQFTYHVNESYLKDRFTLRKKDITVGDILRSISFSSGLSFKQTNNNISVKAEARAKGKSPAVEVVLPPITVNGKVTSDIDSEPLPGVNILVKGTATGTLTDIDGNYTITVPNEDDVLVFSFIGYVSEEVGVNGRSRIDLSLIEDIQSLNEVVVIGYGEVERRDMTGAVSSIKAKEITKTPTPRLDDALRGKVSGVLITPTSGAPGANVTIRIRGSNSLNASNEPLVVIDGFIGAGNLNSINTNDIESIEILKDASATAIYGSRGSNGVILVTTKRGKKGESRFSFDTYTGIQQITRKLDLMSSREYAAFQNDIAASTGASPVFPDLSQIGVGTDWQEEVFRQGLMSNSTLSISTGNEKTRLYLSGNYVNQEGIYINTDFKRYQTRINIDHSINKHWKTGISLSLSRVSQNGGSSSLRNVLGYDPTLDVKDENGDFVVQTRSSEFTNDNPVSIAEQTVNITGHSRINGNIFSELVVLKGLKYKVTAGINTNFTDIDIYQPTTLYSQLALQGTAIVRNNQSSSLLLEQTLNYTIKFGDHSFNTLFGYTRQNDTYKQRGAEVSGFASDVFTTNNLSTGTDRRDITSYFTETGLESYLFRANYSLMDKYLLTVTGRADGSSVFAKNNKWSFFPSAAIAWRVVDENFMKNIPIISDLKIRASYGKTGNQAIGPFQSLAPISNSGNTYIFGPDQNLVIGYSPTALANEDLKWETTTSFDIGLDISFFDHRLSATIDYYEKTTDDLLVSVTTPQLTGFNSALRNFGKVDNNGLELSLNSININNEHFRWETNFNISGNRNKVVDIFNPEGFFLANFGVQGTGGPATAIIQEGQPLGTFYGLVRDGIWNDQAEIDASGLTGYAVFPGGRRYVDVDGDGIVDANLDRKIIGDSNPVYFGGLGNDFAYKGFEFSFFLQFIYGNQVFNEADYYLGQAFDYNAYAYMVDRWTPENTNTSIPSIEGSTRSIATVSETNALKDGSFIRLRNVNLAYNVPLGTIDWLSAAKVYISGTNLLLFDRYDGYDPEINRGTDNLRRGYDDSGYPINRNVILGVILNF